jgi:hypothetical protein
MLFPDVDTQLRPFSNLQETILIQMHMFHVAKIKITVLTRFPLKTGLDRIVITINGT